MQRFSIRSGRVNRVKWRFMLVMLVALVLGNSSAHAQETKAATSTIDEKAMATLMQMAEFLAKAQQLSFTADIGYDVMQEWGQKIELIPNHCCTTVNQHENLIVVKKGKVASIWPITARGKYW